MQSICYSCQTLMKLELSTQIKKKKNSNIKFHENQSREGRVVPCGRTDRNAEATVALHNVAKAPKYQRT